MPARTAISICSCGQRMRASAEICGRCRQRLARKVRIVLTCKQCGRHIHAVSTGSGLCWSCRHKVCRVSNVASPPHIEQRIEVYAARVEARERDELCGGNLFAGFERDRLAERGFAETT